jgi:arsenical pump membrane protein
MSHIWIWTISLLAIAGVIIRPFKWPEAVWAVAGVLLLLLFRLISPREGFNGMARGLDVYLFLTGMMLLAETAREERLFDWLAAHATQLAGGSATRLFGLIYLVGIIVTVFLSNDATAVVLTPAVAAAMRAARVEKPLPYLLVCAFIANAASFVLPISNPANLVIYGAQMPPLLEWVPRYFMPSLMAVGVTFFVLRRTQRGALRQDIVKDIPLLTLEAGGKWAAVGIGVTAVLLLLVSAFGIQLGLPTCLAGVMTAAVVLVRGQRSPRAVLSGVSWSVLPLVAGLFVIVEALGKTGLTGLLSGLLQRSAAGSVAHTAWGSGLGIALISNCMNNLPSGLIAGSALQTAHVPELVKSAVLIGVDLGPNLSVTGSLATILWLLALRREGQGIGAWAFLRLGVLVMVPALVAALAALWI